MKAAVCSTTLLSNIVAEITTHTRNLLGNDCKIQLAIVALRLGGSGYELSQLTSTGGGLNPN